VKDLFCGIMCCLVVLIILMVIATSCDSTDKQLRKCLIGQHSYEKSWPRRELIDGRLYMVRRCICGEQEKEPFNECPTCLRKYTDIN